MIWQDRIQARISYKFLVYTIPHRWGFQHIFGVFWERWKLLLNYLKVVFSLLVHQKIFLLIYCCNLKKLFVQVQPEEYFLFLPGLFDLCRGFCYGCCLRAKSLFHNGTIFEGNLFLCFSRLLHPLCTRYLRESVGLCFVPSKFLCLFRTYGYAIIFTTGISFLFSIVCS